MAGLSPLLNGTTLVNPVYLDEVSNTWKPNTTDRLIFAAKSPTLWCVHYEQQGSAPTWHVAIVGLKDHDP